MILQLCILVGLLLAYLIQKSRKPKNFPPGPPRLPIVGSLPYIMKYKTMFIRTQALFEKYGDITGFYVANHPIVILSNFDAIKQVYKMEETSFRPPRNQEMRYARKDGTGVKGILFSSGNDWKEQRRFTLKNLRDFGFGKASMEDMIKAEAHKLCDSLKKEEGVPTKLDYKLNVAILNALWLMLVGEELSPDNPRHQETINNINELIRGDGPDRSFLQVFPFLSKLYPSFFEKAKQTTDSVKSLMSGVRKFHRDTVDPSNPRDFLDVHISAQMNSDPQSSFHGIEGEQHEEVTLLDLFIAGSETTSTTINWALLYLLHHPEVQDKIHEEMDRVLGGREPCLQDEKSLPYLSATLLEVQRAASIVYVGVPHYANTDISVQGYDIPKGTTIFANILQVMHNPAVFKDPTVFNPDRFLDGDGNVKSHPHVIPFLTGKRTCLGSSLAEKELYVFMSQLFYRFSFKAVPNKPLPSYSIHSRCETSRTIIRFPPTYELIIEERQNI